MVVRLLATTVVATAAFVIVAATCVVLVLWLAGPHGGILPERYTPVVLGVAWLLTVGVPASAAAATWKAIGRRRGSLFNQLWTLSTTSLPRSTSDTPAFARNAAAGLVDARTVESTERCGRRRQLSPPARPPMVGGARAQQSLLMTDREESVPMKPKIRTALALLAGLLVINLLITLWAFVAVAAVWPELAPRPDGTYAFPPGNHPAYVAEMVVNLPVAVLAAYACARIAGRREVAHVAALGGVLLSLSAAYVAGSAGADFGAAKPLWAHAGTALGLVVGLAFGTWLAVRRKQGLRPKSVA